MATDADQATIAAAAPGGGGVGALSAGAGAPEELRIALVMNGGVSLAVWIGGVTAEYARLMAAGRRRLGRIGPGGAAVNGVDAIYDDILRLVDLAPRIDVIAGTSAGGVNAAYLGAAIARTTTAGGLATAMAGLRAVWIDDGAIDDLLRDPAAREAPSLLDGDGYYFGRLSAALARIVPEAAGPGGPGDGAGGLRQAQVERDGAGGRSGAEEARGGEPADGPGGLRQAEAERVTRGEGEALHLTLTTTLMTGEPQHIADDYGTSVADISYRARFRFVRDHPAHPGLNDFAGDAFVTQLALAARATSSFPGAFEPVFCPIQGEDLTAVAPAGRAFMDGIALDAAGAPLTRSRWVIDGGVLDNKPLDVAIAAIAGLPAGRRAARVLAYVAPDPGEGDAPMPPAATVDAPPGVLRVVADSLVTIPMAQGVSNQINVLRAHNAAVRGRRLDRSAIAGSIDRAALFALAGGLIGAYRQRRFTRLIEEAAEAINAQLSQLPGRQPMVADGRLRARMTAAMRGLYDGGRLLIAAAAPVAPGVVAVAAPGVWRWGHRAVVHIGWLAYDLLVRFERGVPAARRGETAGLWADLSAAQSEADRWLRATGARWRSGDLAGIIDDLRAGDAAGFCGLAMGAIGVGVAEAAGGGALERLAETVAGVVVRLADMAFDAGIDPAGELGRLIALVAPVSAAGAAPPVAEVLAALLAWHVVDDTLGGGGTLAEEDIRFIQVSANDDEVVAKARGMVPRAAPAKLSSVQLGAFAGFYKQSWRARDWTWGRRDAVGRILRVLLDPQRLRAAGATVDAVWDVVAAASAAAGTKADAAVELAIRDEFKRVAAGAGDAGDDLPLTIGALADALETLMLAEEMGPIARAIADDGVARVHVPQPLAELRRDIEAAAARGPATLIALARGLLPQADDRALCAEPWQDELGSDAAMLTGAKGLAVAMNVIGTSAAPLGWLAPVLAPVRRGTGLFYLFARGNFAQSRIMLNVCCGVLLASAVMILSQIAAGAHYGAALGGAAYGGFAVSWLAIALADRMPSSRRRPWLVAALIAVPAGLAVAGLVALFMRIPPPAAPPPLIDHHCTAATFSGDCSRLVTLRQWLPEPVRTIALVEFVAGIVLLAWPLRALVALVRPRRRTPAPVIAAPASPGHGPAAIIPPRQAN